MYISSSLASITISDSGKMQIGVMHLSRREHFREIETACCLCCGYIFSWLAQMAKSQDQSMSSFLDRLCLVRNSIGLTPSLSISLKFAYSTVCICQDKQLWINNPRHCHQNFCIQFLEATYSVRHCLLLTLWLDTDIVWALLDLNTSSIDGLVFWKQVLFDGDSDL